MALGDDGLSLAEIADKQKTPVYVYCGRHIVETYQAYDAAFGQRSHLVCYAVKANPAHAILAALAKVGAGFDIVSGGELTRVLGAGGDPARIVFAGVGKMDDELEAALDAGIRSFNVESHAELHRLNTLAQRKHCVAPVALRVNPDIPADTHPHIATGDAKHKFGISQQQIAPLAAATASLPGIALHGLAMHIGSQITALAPFADAAKRLRALAIELRKTGINLKHVDLGGGLGVGKEAPTIPDYVGTLTKLFPADDCLELIIEPGRSIVAHAGVLVTSVVRLKHGDEHSFAIVDAGMNDLLRPALYGAYHDIVNVDATAKPPTGTYDIVGPVCETSDTLGARRRLAIREGSVLAIMGVGAYGATMSSHYNSRPRCPEIMVESGVARLTRQRETVEELSRNEKFMTTNNE